MHLALLKIKKISITLNQYKDCKKVHLELVKKRNYTLYIQKN